MSTVAAAFGGTTIPAGTNMDPFTALRDPKANDVPEPPPAKIRPFSAENDLKIFRYLIGAQIMEPSATANSTALFSLVGLIAWAALTQLFLTRIGPGWPSAAQDVYAFIRGQSAYPFTFKKTFIQHVTEWLTASPLLVAPPIILLAVFELIHRYKFEDEMTRAIGEEDMRDVEGYYGQGREEKDFEPTVRQGAWVLEYDGRIIGAATLDGRKPGQSLDSVVDLVEEGQGKKDLDDGQLRKSDSAKSSATDSSPYPLRNRVKKEDTPSLSLTPPTPSIGKPTSAFPLTSKPLPDGVLHIRRFATSLSFRPADIEDELFEFITDYAFSSEETSKLVIACRPTVQRDFVRRLKKNGFELVPKGSGLEVPIVGAPTIPQPASVKDTIVEAIWPISLEPRTFVLTRNAYEKVKATREQ